MYKIKLRQLGYRLVYSVEDKTITVTVIAIGKRNRNEVYDLALSRMRKQFILVTRVPDLPLPAQR
jgi:mRNA interferase RelE/StbE